MLVMEVEIEFVEFSSENDFYYIANILSKNLGFRRLKTIEGPDAIVCEFVAKSFRFWLVWDDITGNFLKTERVNDAEKLSEIFETVETALKFNYK